MCKSMHSLPCVMCVTYDFVTVYTYYVHNFSTLEIPSPKAGAKRKYVLVSSSDDMLEQGTN